MPFLSLLSLTMAHRTRHSRPDPAEDRPVLMDEHPERQRMWAKRGILGDTLNGCSHYEPEGSWKNIELRKSRRRKHIRRLKYVGNLIAAERKRRELLEGTLARMSDGQATIADLDDIGVVDPNPRPTRTDSIIDMRSHVGWPSIARGRSRQQQRQQLGQSSALRPSSSAASMSTMATNSERGAGGNVGLSRVGKYEGHGGVWDKRKQVR